MGTRPADCRKFTPNIFNKSKCSHCFRQREEHSAAALECNRACRKVSKCGYLFVAPDWDFSNPLYRTKRWQRRWFVLYDDGELTYSVDEHPETIPQACIDMTKVLEVSTAEDVTGHVNSLAVTAPDRVTFVKGTCPDEAKWWLNILSAFPKTKGRHKRNATFPGGQTTTILQSQSATTPSGRNRHNSYHTDSIPSPMASLEALPAAWSVPALPESAGDSLSRVYTDQPVSSKSPPTRDKLHPEGKAQARIRSRNRVAQDSASDSATECLIIEDARRDEKLKNIANTITNLSHHSITTSVGSPVINNRWSTVDDKPTRDETDYIMEFTPATANTILNNTPVRPKSLAIISPTAPAIVSAIVKKLPPTMSKTDLDTARLISSLKQQAHERGDPDGGCNLDDISSNYLAKNSELRVNLPSEEILNSKKGWLMKQELRSGEWTKHWFTLRGAALFYYRDPVAEDRGVLDGVLDVNGLTNVSEIPVARNYGFQLTMWDNKRIVLSTVNSNTRGNWINVLNNAAGLNQKPQQPPPQCQNEMVGPIVEMKDEKIIKDNTSDDLKSEIEKDFMKAQRNQDIIINTISAHETTNGEVTPVGSKTLTPVTPITPKSILFSSDEEYRTASEGGRRDSVDWGSPMSPSPPVPLSLSRTKDRVRSRSNSGSRLHKRSRSSPPSSRRSTVDSVGSEDMIMIRPVLEEMSGDIELQSRFNAAEKELRVLRDEGHEREARMTDLLSTLERTELELSHRIQETEEARTVLELQLAENRLKADELAARLTIDVEESQKRCKELEDRLTRGIEENEVLYKKIREIENSSGHATSLSNLNRTKMKRMDSLSDLTCLNDIDPYCLDRDMLADEYNDLKSRFEKAINEIRAMKKELRESQNEFDQLEISHAALKQDLERQEREDRCQIKMMAQRIQDLTVKYSNSERQVRALKQKLAKSEKRRSLSLKGRESLTVQKELEEKVVELENKIDHLEAGQVNGASDGTRADATQQDERSLRRAAARLRRKSLDSPSDAMQMMLRIGTLEKRVERATISPTKKEQITASPNNSSSKISEHLLERLRTLEGVVISSKDRIEQGLQQLQSLKSSRTRRSVSPIAERKDSFRFIERCLTETVKVLRDSCDTCIVHDSLPTGNLILLPETSPIKLALTQLEAQLRGKLGDLLKQRRFLREHNELTPRKDIELLAERIAYESVCFGRLRDAISRAENPALFGEQQTQTEVAETAQLMSYLKMKLSGKTTIKPSGSADILASVLARRLVLSTGRSGQLKLPEMAPINQNIMEDLLRQQNELNLIAKRYKNNAMENLASGLAAETLSYISTNDAVQGAVQEAWRQAQEVVNAELVQSEIGNIMMRNAKRFENSLTPAFGYTLTSEERVSFENFSDAVQDALRKEMELAINALNQCYAECMTKMKRGQWRMHLEHEHNASTGRQLLAEFADIVAHKALVDARISVLKGEYTTKDLSTTKGNQFNVAALQKYENLFTELATDLQVSNADDILAEADFNFLYKNFTTEYITNKEELREASSVLNKLEQAVVMLQSTLNPNTSVSMSIFEADNLQSLCQKCADLQSRVESLNPCAQRLQAACEDCDRMQEAIIHLSDHHQSEMESLSHQHELQCNTMQRNLDEQSAIVERLRREREETISVLDRERTSLAQREQEFKDVCKKFSTLESEYQTAEADKSEIVQCLDNTRVQAIMHADETKKAMEKCRAQADELNAVLEERDFIQEQLDRERERVRKLEMKLELLEQEHSQQMDNLHAAYKSHHDTNSSDNERERNEEECFRKRYQAEIEQLRTLCEKGLSAMESSHRRIINELEEKHRQETQHLLSDKEQALAEETQATLAALDAMRKAHQIEVQREVARFKAEFIKQFQKGNQPEVNHRGNEEELEEVRQEILSLSEKYSFKCVETAKLEEKLRMVTQQLKQFQMHIQQLEVRNKQLRAHLVADEPDLSFTQSLSRETSLSSTSEV